MRLQDGAYTKIILVTATPAPVVIGWRELSRLARSEVPPFYKSSAVWVLDFTYQGRPRRWVRAIPAGVDPRPGFETEIRELYGSRGRVEDVRLATEDEETQYLRGTLPVNVMCPTGRGGG